MSNKTEQQEKTVYQLWRELGISYANYEFDCGGDSMGSTTLTLIGKDGEQISNQEIEDYIENEIYNRVEFYVNSDGHYQGEAGTVEITLDEDGEDFSYCKSSTSEWCESLTSEIQIELDEKEIAFIKERLLNINGSMDNFTVNYKTDFILTDEDEELVDKLKDKMYGELSSFRPETKHEVREWYTFTTDIGNKEITFDGNELKVEITNEVTEYREE